MRLRQLIVSGSACLGRNICNFYSGEGQNSVVEESLIFEPVPIQALLVPSENKRRTQRNDDRDRPRHGKTQIPRASPLAG